MNHFDQQILLFNFTNESFIEFLAAILAVATIFILWKHRKSQEVVYVILVELCAAIWAFTYGFEFGTQSLETKILWSQLSYLGIAFLPVSYFLFTTAFSQKTNIITPKNVALFLIIPVITLLLVFTNDWHHLVWSSVHMDPEMNIAHYHHGVWFWVFWIYSFGLILAGIYNLLHSIRKFTAYYRSQVSTLLIATLIPLIGNIMYVSGLNPVPGFDWTPTLFVFTGLVVTFGIVRYRMFDLVPIARNKLIETMDDGVMVVNAEGFIEDCNSAVYKIFPLQDTSIIRKSTHTIFAAYDKFLAAIEKNGAGNQSTDIAILNNNKERHYQTRVSPVYDQKNQFSGHFIQIHDITSMKEAEKELKETNQQLLDEIEKRGKLIDDLDSFAHTVAHDLKNSLGSISSTTQIMEESIENEEIEILPDLTGLVKSSANKAIQITQELLVLATISNEDIEFKPLDMAALFSDAEEQIAQLSLAYQATINRPESWPGVTGHAPWIEEVWTNYMSNAIKYGGRPPVVEAGYDYPDKGKVRFWVKDNGDGIAPEDQSKLFRKYARLAPEKAEGYGLGLSIVKRIIEKSRGTVGLESSGIEGEGSLFYFILPIRG